MSLGILFHYLMLNMFRMLIHPSSGACDLFGELFHGFYCSGSMCVGVALWFGWGGLVSGLGQIPDTGLGQPNPVHIPTSHLLEIHPNIIHPSTSRSPQWSLFLRFPHQDPIHPPHLTHTCHMSSPSHSSFSISIYKTFYVISL